MVTTRRTRHTSPKPTRGATMSKSGTSSRSRSASARRRGESARDAVLGQTDSFGLGNVYKNPSPHNSFHYTHNPIAGKPPLVGQRAPEPVGAGKTPIRVKIVRRRMDSMVERKALHQRRNMSCGKNKESVTNADGSYSCRALCKDGQVRNVKTNRCILSARARKERADAKKRVEKTCKRSHYLKNNRCALRSRAELAKIVNGM